MKARTNIYSFIPLPRTSTSSLNSIETHLNDLYLVFLNYTSSFFHFLYLARATRFFLFQPVLLCFSPNDPPRLGIGPPSRQGRLFPPFPLPLREMLSSMEVRRLSIFHRDVNYSKGGPVR
jgi:hypothetical protein